MHIQCRDVQFVTKTGDKFFFGDCKYVGQKDLFQRFSFHLCMDFMKIIDIICESVFIFC